MNIAVLSDIHGNDIALEACLKYLEGRDIDAYCFLGDYTGELPGIEKTMKMLYALKSEHECYFSGAIRRITRLTGLDRSIRSGTSSRLRSVCFDMHTSI